MAPVLRRGDTVRRVAGLWTPTVHRLLTHLRAAGVAGLPEPRGLDEQGREVLTHLPGFVPSYPLPAWVWSDAVLVDAARRLAAVHRASAGFDRSGAVWQLPEHAPAEVVCHNDFAPYNLVFDDDHRLSGVIDWDTASPGPRVWDVAYLAYRLAPLMADDNPDALRSEASERRRRVGLLLAAYGSAAPSRAEVLATAVERLDDLADFTARRAAERPELNAHVAQYRADAAWLRSGPLASTP